MRLEWDGWIDQNDETHTGDIMSARHAEERSAEEERAEQVQMRRKKKVQMEGGEK